MEGPTVLVVARKFNDIFYAVSSKEFKEAKSRKLLIMSNFSKDEFPLLDRFDKVIFIPAPDLTWKGQLRILSQLRKLKRELSCDIIFFSNIVLLAHYYIVKLTGCKRIILLEDGYMNYRGDTFDNNKTKELVLRLMGIGKNYMKNRVVKTYLLNPEEAKYYFGKKEKLNLDSEISNLYTGPGLKNKKIFIGQPIYKNGKVSKEEYCIVVNQIIKKFGIDYYIPHLSSDTDEEVDTQIINTTNQGITLEAIAANTNFTLYSFSSSLLFTSRLINPQIESYLVEAENIPKLLDKDIFIKSGVKEVQI